MKFSTADFQSFLPGSHKRARIASRFVRLENGGTGFEAVPGVEANNEDWEKEAGWQQAACEAGALVLIHGQYCIAQ
jgi:phytanoyl-CoA hydroxylase